MDVVKFELEFDHVKGVILDLLKDGERKLAWTLIDNYFKKSTTIQHFDILGYVSLKAEKRDTYLKCAEYAHAIAKDPVQLYITRMNLVKAYNAMNRPEDALFYAEQNLKINPDDFESLCQRAFNISLMGDKLKAEEILTELAKQYPDKLTAAFAGKHLREGRTAEGILSFVEAFKPENEFFEKRMGMKRWKGSITPGRKLYIDIEGGIGDQIVNIRFFNKLQSYGMEPILFSRDNKYYKDVNNVFRARGYEILTDPIIIDKKEKWVPMMSIPGYLNLSESDLWSGVYLQPMRSEKNKLESTKRKIGIKCSGNPYFAQDEYRKIPLQEILNILPKDVEIYYIDVEEIQTSDSRVINLSDRINSWEDTLDFIDQMDCIVSSCTSLVHAAGAMGKTTFVAVPIAEYYIWTTTKTDGSSPWYGDNFYVARQKKVRDWTEPLNDIGNRVHKLLELNHD
jgi:hypothetical protein